MQTPESAAGRELRDQIIEAITEEPARPVPSPAWPQRYSPAHEILVSELEAHPALAVDAARVIGMAAQCTDPALRVLAQAVIAQVAARFAYFHEDQLPAERDRYDDWNERAPWTIPSHQRAL